MLVFNQSPDPTHLPVELLLAGDKPRGHFWSSSHLTSQRYLTSTSVLTLFSLPPPGFLSSTPAVSSPFAGCSSSLLPPKSRFSGPLLFPHLKFWKAISVTHWRLPDFDHYPRSAYWNHQSVSHSHLKLLNIAKIEPMFPIALFLLQSPWIVP